MEYSSLIFVAAVIIFLIIRHMSLIKPAQARQLAASGAIIVDVRTAGEYSGGHLVEALNIPLDTISGEIRKMVPDQNRAILVYCLSGARSGIAVRMIKNLGYASVHNLGSLSRARGIFS